MSGMGEPGFGANLDEAGLNAGTTGSEALGDRGTGTAEVHTELSMGRGTGSDRGYSAIAANTGTGEGGLQEKALNRVRGVAGQVRDRVQDVPGQARERMGQAMDRAESLLEERGVLNKVRENPLPALGIAFGLGFLLAGSDDESREKRGGTMSKAKHQLRGAIIGGLSAAVAQEARNLLGMAQGKGSQGGMLGSLFESLQGGGSGGQGGSSGRSGGTSGGGSASTHRPPSHQELS
jgi:ElaB/YqjD/DUF883 family membrane-anchored ribosome-binding protein